MMKITTTWFCDEMRFAVLLDGYRELACYNTLFNLPSLVFKISHPVSFRVKWQWL